MEEAGAAAATPKSALPTPATGEQSSSSTVPVETSLESEPLSTLSEPLPLPPYEFDPSLSEDENMLTWVSILARHSFSKKGHMGTIFVAPPATGDPSSPSPSSCQPHISSRIRAYANNTPLLYARCNAKTRGAVPEIHAEALAISRSARRGVSLAGVTVYISFPPCNECFKLLLGAGVARCVFKKSVLPTEQGDSVLVAAEAAGVEMKGTLDDMMRARVKDGGLESEKRVKKADRKPLSEEVQRLREKEHEEDETRDTRVRAFWAAQGEDSTKTRARVERAWQDWHQRYREAKTRVHARWGRLRFRGQRNEDDEDDDIDGCDDAKEAGPQAKQQTKGDDVTAEEVDMDELANAQEPIVAKRPSEDGEAIGLIEKKVQRRE